MAASNLIAICFLSRDVAHREHLKTNSYAAHVALGEFYNAIVDLADKLAEAYQGRGKDLQPIPYLEPEGADAIGKQLESHMGAIESLRYTALDKEDTPLQNIVDEIVGQYLSTLYKLRKFK